MPSARREPATQAERLTALLDHLGIAAAHVATQMPGDVAGLIALAPERVAGVVLAVPVRLDPASFVPVASRTLIMAGEHGIGAPVAARAMQNLAGAACHTLAGYDAPGWADLAADRTAEVVDVMRRFLMSAQLSSAGTIPSRPVPSKGRFAEISWRAEGAGPALVLLPFFLAPSQWDPVVPALAQHFTVIRVGGAHVGGVAALEDRARQKSYRALFRTLVHHLAPRATDRILDVGCGSGALDRLLAELKMTSVPIEAIDLNAYLLAEAAELADGAGLASAIRFSRGSAVDLPFADGSFDCAFSVTVLEECDARKATAELKRVLKPGGRMGVIVRAIDMQQWWSFAVPDDVKRIANVPPQSIGKGGVADARLYAMLTEAGMADLIPFPSLMTIDDPGGSVWRYREDAVLADLAPQQRTVWEAARDEAAAAGLLFQAQALHCAVARKPG